MPRFSGLFSRSMRLRLAVAALALAHGGAAFGGSIWTPVESTTVICSCPICAGWRMVAMSNEPHVGSVPLYDATMPTTPMDVSLVDYAPMPELQPAATLSVYNPAASNPDSLGSFTININAGAGLASNAAALAAFQRAAQQWANHISDPISIYIDADFVNMGSTTIIGSTSSLTYSAPYNDVLALLQSDAAAEADDALVAHLPSSSQFVATMPEGFTLSGNIAATRANIKAFDPNYFTDAASDGLIQFNTGFSFDFDNSNGVAAGTVDFETVAAHEIGHLLGFVTEVDRIDSAMSANIVLTDVNPRTLDLFRFINDQDGLDPANLDDFATFPRRLAPGGDHILDLITPIANLPDELKLSTGRLNGNGSQASHWRDNNLTGLTLGVMDPTLPNQTIIPVSTADLRALDLIGYDINIPEPGTGLLLLAGGMIVLGHRRSSAS